MEFQKVPYNCPLTRAFKKKGRESFKRELQGPLLDHKGKERGIWMGIWYQNGPLFKGKCDPTTQC